MTRKPNETTGAYHERLASPYADEPFAIEYRDAYGKLDFERMARVLSGRLNEMDKRARAANKRADEMQAELTRERRGKEAAIGQARSWMRYARNLVRQRDEVLAAFPAHATGAMREGAAALAASVQGADFKLEVGDRYSISLANANRMVDQARHLTAALSSPAQEGEADPVRTDADGVREDVGGAIHRSDCQLHDGPANIPSICSCGADLLAEPISHGSEFPSKDAELGYRAGFFDGRRHQQRKRREAAR